MTPSHPTQMDQQSGMPVHTARSALLRALTACGHQIKEGEVRLFADDSKPGNALGQVATRIETAHAELVAALLASHQRLAEALRSVAATSSDISDETLTQYASGEFDHQTTAEAKAILATRAALASIPKETT